MGKGKRLRKDFFAKKKWTKRKTKTGEVKAWTGGKNRRGTGS